MGKKGYFFVGLSCIVFMVLFTLTLKAFDIPIYVEFDEPITVLNNLGRYSEYEEVEGQFTLVGLTAILSSLMLGFRVMLFSKPKIGDAKENESFYINYDSCIIGCLVFGILEAIFFKSAYNLHHSLKFIVDLTLAVVIFYFCKKWRDKMMLKLEDKKL